MSQKNKYRPTASDFLDYSEGKLSGSKRNAFERYLEQNLFDAEATEGLSMVSREEAELDIAAVGGKIHRRINRKRRIGWYSAAATIASILVVSTIFFNIDRAPSEQKDRIREMSKAAEEIGGGVSSPETAPQIDDKEAIIKDDKIEDKKTIIDKEETLEYEDSDISQIETKADGEAVVPVPAYINEEITNEDLSFQAVEMEDLDETENDEYTDTEGFAKEDMGEQYEAAQPMAAITDKSVQALSASKRRAKTSPDMDQVRIRGVVISSEDSEPIPGASLILKGTTVGTVADMDGNFEMDISDTEENIVVASFIGMESEELPVATDESMKIVMDPSATSLDEVVVIGYGTQRTSQPTGAVVKLESEVPASYKSAVPEVGISAFKDYMDATLVFPISEYDLSKAVVVLKFYVLPNGRPHNIQIIRSPSDAFSNEAQRVITEGPKWIPATRDGEYVDDELRMRVVFEEEHKRE